MEVFLRTSKIVLSLLYSDYSVFKAASYILTYHLFSINLFFTGSSHCEKILAKNLQIDG